MSNKIEPPRLDELLKEKTTFVLGAGSSKPYGFPEWEELKPKFLSRCIDLDGTPEHESLGLQYWQHCLRDGEKKSVDTLAKEANDSARSGFQHLVGKILIEQENIDASSNNNDWIELLVKKLILLSETNSPANILPNLNVINLNYDRCFCHRFSNLFKSVYEAFPGTWERQANLPSYGTGYRYQIHPHGALGNIAYSFVEERSFGITASTFASFGTLPVVPYGNIEAYERAVASKKIQLMPVDVVGSDTWHGRAEIAYIKANSALSKSRNVIFIGVSELGYEQSHLSVPDSARCWSASKTPVADNITCVGHYAKEFIEML